MKPERLREKVRGVTLIMMTPFKDNLSVDKAGLKKNVRYLIQQRLIAYPDIFNQPGRDIAVIKVGMDMLGLSGGPVRPPLLQARAEDKENVRKFLSKLGLEIKDNTRRKVE